MVEDLLQFNDDHTMLILMHIYAGDYKLRSLV